MNTLRLIHIAAHRSGKAVRSSSSTPTQHVHTDSTAIKTLNMDLILYGGTSQALSTLTREQLEQQVAEQEKRQKEVRIHSETLRKQCVT